MSKTLIVLAIFILAALAATMFIDSPPPEKELSYAEQRVKKLMEKTAVFRPDTAIDKQFAPIQHVPFEDAEKGSETVDDSMLVLGVEHGGIAKAYPIGMLCGPEREIVNDTFGEHSLAATWCHLCHNGIVYDRNVDGKILNFRVSGKLWNKSLVMADAETESLWCHLLGKAMDGELEGTQLQTIPSVITSWADWKSLHPDTSIMVWPQDRGQEYKTSFFDSPIAKNTYGVGYLDGDSAKCYPNNVLSQMPLINDNVANVAIVIFSDVKTRGAWCYERTIGQKTHEFYIENEIVMDKGTGSSWNLKSGLCTDGKLKGTQLVRRVLIPSNAKAWKTFHPRTEVFQGKSRQPPQ